MRLEHALVKNRPAFTLPVVLIGVSGMLILLVGLLSTLNLERQTARTVSDIYRAELIAESALIEVERVLKDATQGENYLVTRAETEVTIASETRTREHYWIGRPSEEATAAGSYDWIPLYSADLDGDTFATKPLAEMPEELAFPADDESATIPLEPWQLDATAEWQEIKAPDTGEVVGRYAYYIEDMQGRLDASLAGNVATEGGRHDDFYLVGETDAPGRRQAEDGVEWPALGGVHLHTLFDGADSDAGTSTFPGDVIALRDRLAGDGELGDLAASLDPSFIRSLQSEDMVERSRDAEGRNRLVDTMARIVEEELVFLLRPYDELALVPLAEGIEATVVGERKLNLNELLAVDRGEAIERFSDFVERALPRFDEERKGGFPDDYLGTLAANAFDYADSDDLPSSGIGVRGLDTFPLISEFAMRFEWVGIDRSTDRLRLLMEVETIVELWNMGNFEVSGDFHCSYETDFSFQAGAIPAISLTDPDYLDDVTQTEHALTKVGDSYYFPKTRVSLPANGMSAISMGVVRYSIDLGPKDNLFVASPLELTGDDGNSGYEAFWNDAPTEATRGEIDRNNVTLHFPARGADRPGQRVRTTIPGHSYGQFGEFKNNMGDPRMAHYIDEPQSANGYPRNWSPGVRNIRWDIFARSGGDRSIFSRVFPSEWPDGGHDSPTGRDHKERDERLHPLDTKFTDGAPPNVPANFIAYFSNQGRFHSVTELGHVYDPVMWDSGAEERNPDRWLDIDRRAKASSHYGGGNTLRIGRLEHSRFREPGSRAAHLLDLFHAGAISEEEDKPELSPLQRIESHVNINTASEEVIRALVAGTIKVDSAVVAERGTVLKGSFNAPRVTRIPGGELGTPKENEAADVIAREIIAKRPFASVAETASLVNGRNVGIFGDKELYADFDLQWNDRAAESVFSKLYHTATVRSRNFKVTVIGQTIDKAGNVRATHRHVYHTFLDPGARADDGSLIPENVDLQIISHYAN